MSADPFKLDATFTGFDRRTSEQAIKAAIHGKELRGLTFHNSRSGWPALTHISEPLTAWRKLAG